ncbi:hypothetical protein R3W88_031583 [Solanum pinnatisectum]|uniref:Uncharacterized protein n=1 Tax=Solanum pinnatisectum TaxID=50273 RepID=A0AAV9LLQ4_9SOLN|nr:hypothetical protein R3W88_031583 [Solanum pinnatisectum]
MCREVAESKEFTNTTSYSESEFESSSDALQKNQKKILEEYDFNDHNKVTPPDEKEHVSVKETLPLIFQFED